MAACTRPWTGAFLPTPTSYWIPNQATSAPISTVPVTPTVSYSLPVQRPPGAPALIPTPDTPHYQAGTRRGEESYVVQPGDTLGEIAQRYSVSVDQLVQANSIPDSDALEVGEMLTIPVVTPQPIGPAIKIIPDSELVYGPVRASFDIAAFIQSKGEYLAGYTQDVNGVTMNAAQVVQRIAQNYSVSPQLLLAALDYRSGWVTKPAPDPSLGETPFGYINDWYVGLYRQLAWAAIQFNSGFYRWQADGVTDWVLGDGSVVPIDPTINAGTAGVQNFFASQDDYSTWLKDVSPGGFADTYIRLFGSPFDMAIEPLIPANLAQPVLLLPFGPGETWAFTGGPHLAWDAGTPFGALDFAPPGEAQGCVVSNAWVTAVADGLVTRTGEGVVVLDLDGDGNEGSGWVVVYMHVESRDRVMPGTFLHAGERVGHPSCEGGISTGTHVHLARKFNGLWIAADGQVPFNLSGWVASGTGEEYVGSLTRAGVVVESYGGNSTVNQIQR
jgi:LasA protease